MNTAQAYEGLLALALQPGPDARLILADWHEERGELREMAIWRWMSDREPLDFRDWTKLFDSRYRPEDIRNAWVWLRSGSNNCGYANQARKLNRPWELALVNSKIFNELRKVGPWNALNLLWCGIQEYFDAISILYRACKDSTHFPLAQQLTDPLNYVV
jgi:hypothetical protein